MDSLTLNKILIVSLGNKQKMENKLWESPIAYKPILRQLHQQAVVTIKKATFKIILTVVVLEKIPLTEDTESLDRCG